jgi:hypothetical protein
LFILVLLLLRKKKCCFSIEDKVWVQNRICKSKTIQDYNLEEAKGTHSDGHSHSFLTSLFVPGVPVVRAGGVHGEHGDLRYGGGGQAGRRAGDAAAALLPPALHPRLWLLHERPLGHLLRSGLGLHTGQLARSLQSLSRYRYLHFFLSES